MRDRSIDHESHGNVSAFHERKSMKIGQTASIRDIALIGTRVRFLKRNQTRASIGTIFRIEAVFAIFTDRRVPLISHTIWISSESFAVGKVEPRLRRALERVVW